MESLQVAGEDLAREVSEFNVNHQSALKQLASPEKPPTSRNSTSPRTVTTAPPLPPRTNARPTFDPPDAPVNVGRMVYPSTLPKEEFEAQHELLGAFFPLSLVGLLGRWLPATRHPTTS